MDTRHTHSAKYTSPGTATEQAVALGQDGTDWTPTRMPQDSDGSELPAMLHDTLHFPIEEQLAAKVLKVAVGEELNISAILLSGVFTLLRKYLGEEKLVIGMPMVEQKREAGTANRLIPFCLDWLAGTSFKDTMMKVKRSMRELIAHQNDPMGTIMSFPVAYAFERLQLSDPIHRENCEIAFVFRQDEHRLHLDIRYATALFSSERITQAGHHLLYLLQQCLEQPEADVSTFELLTPVEQIPSMPQVGSLHSYSSVISVFAAQVQRYPDNPALVYQDRYVTYRELNNRANALAAGIRKKVKGKDHIVGILLERSVDMIVSILGIMKAGGCYLPLDPSHPADRIAYILEDSGCQLVLSNKERKTELAESVEVFDVTDLPEIEVEEVTPLTVPEDLLYIIYTSGTTGKPKGAQIENRNLLALFFADHMPFDFGPSDTWVLFHSYCFDFSVWEIFGALLFGGKLVIMSDVDVRSPETLVKVMQDHQVSVLNQTPSAFYNLIFESSKRWPVLEHLKMVVFGGEALSPVKLMQWYQQYPHVRLINMYGITETTIHVTYKELIASDLNSNRSNIGQALPHLAVRILNKDGNILPPGYVGEINVSGHSVCRGYLNKPTLTESKFYLSETERIYRSGDLAYFNFYGELVYLGRKDTQVQLRGYRIELGEIEAALLKYPGIANALVICREVSEEEKYLCAYYVAESSRDHKELRIFLSRVLPAYMIPSYFFFLDKLPLNHNGKIDMARLPEIKQTGYLPTAMSSTATAVAGKLLDIWKHNLGLDEVPVDESYFNIGGDSIKALRLLNLINAAFPVKLRLKDIYLHNTLTALSALLDQQPQDEEADLYLQVDIALEKMKQEVLAQDALAGHIEEVYPMADIQKGMVFYGSMDTGVPFYHDQMVHTLHLPDFDYDVFTKAICRMCERHAILRTAFNITGYSEPLQIVYRTCTPDIAKVDIRDRTTAEQTAVIRQYLEDDKRQPLDVSHAPIWRVRVFMLSEDTVTLLLVFHHAIIDGWSDAAFKTELYNTYLKLLKGDMEVAPALKSSYRDYVREEMYSKRSKKVRAFWSRELAGYHRLNITGTNGERQKRILSTYTLQLPGSLFTAVDRFCIAQRVSVKTTFFSVYAILLSAIGKTNSFVAGYCTHNRPIGPDADQLLGCFLNVIPVKTVIGPGTSWIAVVQQLEQQLIKLKEYDNLSLMEILGTLGKSTTDANPLFDVLFNYIDFHVYDQLQAPAQLVYDAGSNEGYANTNTLLDFNISNTQDVFELIINYAGNILSPSVVKIMGYYFKRILEQLVGASDNLVTMANDPGDHVLHKILGLREGVVANDTARVTMPINIPADTVKAIDLLMMRHHIDMEALLITTLKMLVYKNTFQNVACIGFQMKPGLFLSEVSDVLEAYNYVMPVAISLEIDGSFLHNCEHIAALLSRYKDSAIDHNQLLDLLFEQQSLPGDQDMLIAFSSLDIQPNQPVVLQLNSGRQGWQIELLAVDSVNAEVLESLSEELSLLLTRAAGDPLMTINDLCISRQETPKAIDNKDILKAFNF